MTNKRGLPYAANNMVRVLIALGEYGKAVSFTESYDGNISKSLIKRATDLKAQKGAVAPEKTFVQNEAEDEHDDVDDIPEFNAPISIGAKHEQFTSEKLLEDELTARLERGHGAFGLPLIVYSEKGDPFYGRQYGLGDGRRIDILAVDPDGNYYVIELKKDSGYGDVLSQTVEYMKWVEKNLARKKKSVFGIICLSNPSRALVEQVKANEQLRLFEYAISYTEVT